MLPHTVKAVLHAFLVFGDLQEKPTALLLLWNTTSQQACTTFIPMIRYLEEHSLLTIKNSLLSYITALEEEIHHGVADTRDDKAISSCESFHCEEHLDFVLRGMFCKETVSYKILCEPVSSNSTTSTPPIVNSWAISDQPVNRLLCLPVFKRHCLSLSGGAV